jgi:hypothetical protein
MFPHSPVKFQKQKSWPREVILNAKHFSRVVKPFIYKQLSLARATGPTARGILIPAVLQILT